MEPDEEWAYRLRDMAPSQRVRVLSIDRRKHTTRALIEFLEGERAGVVEDVPAGRLRCPWSRVAEHDTRMANWQRISGYELTPVEERAVWVVAELLMPEEIVTIDVGYARNAAGIEDETRLGPITGKLATDFTDAFPSFRDGDTWWLSAEGTVAIVEAACRVRPMPILEWVVAEERKCREACKRGSPRKSLDGEEYDSSPDREYALYLEFERPVHELLRLWCGHRAVTFQERLDAAEAEIHRLDELLARAADSSRDNKLPHLADWLDEEHERDRITPHNIRPVVERPLDPNEIPVRTVHRKAWWR